MKPIMWTIFLKHDADKIDYYKSIQNACLLFLA